MPRRQSLNPHHRYKTATYLPKTHCVPVFADVTSENTVGYTGKDKIEKDTFYILASQFEGVAGGKNVNDILGAVTGVDYDDGGVFCDTATQIQIPKTGGYTTYYYLNDGWFDDNGKDGYKAGWCDSIGNLVDVEIPDGVAIWFKNKVDTDSSWTHSGAVPAEDAKRVEYPEGFALRSNAFPVSFKLNSDALDNSEVIGVDYDDGGNFCNTATQIQIPKTGGYTTYYYLNDGWFDDNGKDGYKAGWCDSIGNIVDVDVPVMQGFWTKGVSGAAALTFKLNLAK